MIAIVLAMCAAFGAVDQYVGSLTRFWPSAWQVSALSAPWLVLPFLVGWTQRRSVPAAVYGGVGTLAALVGYMLMTLSPVEHAQLTLTGVEGFVRSNQLWFAAALVTGPLFGWLGHRWRVARTWWAAAVVAAAVALEPLVHAGPYHAIPFGTVTEAEIAAGLAMAAWFGRQLARARRLT